MTTWQRSLGAGLIAVAFTLLFPDLAWWRVGIASGLFSSALYLPFER